MKKDDWLFLELIIIFVAAFSAGLGAYQWGNKLAKDYCQSQGYKDGYYDYHIIQQFPCINETAYERFVCDGKEVFNLTDIETHSVLCNAEPMSNIGWLATIIFAITCIFVVGIMIMILGD